jgi:hypothetical protein
LASFCAALAVPPLKLEREGDRAAVVRHEPGRRVDRQRGDLLGVSCATSSMLIPPSVETIIAMRLVCRSISSAR